MARTFLTPIDLAQNELQNAVVQNLPLAPANPLPGQEYYDSPSNTLVWWDGTAWVPAKGTASADVDAAIDAKVDDLSIVSTSSSLTATASGTSAGGDRTWTLALDSLTLSNTYAGVGPPATAVPPPVTSEPGDIYVDTSTGQSYISDGTTWIQLAPGVPGVTAVGAGDGIAVDATNPNVPSVSVVVDPATDPLLTVSATGVKLDPAVVNTTEMDAAIALAIGAIPAPTPIVAGNGLTDTAGTFAVGAGVGLAVAADAVSVLVDPTGVPALTVSAAGIKLDATGLTTIAGDGLTQGVGKINVVNTDGSLTVSADEVQVNIDPVAGNALVNDPTGLGLSVVIPPGSIYLAGAGLAETTAGTFDVVATAAGGLVVAADSVGVLVDPDPTNALSVSAAGLLVAAGVQKFVAAAQAMVANTALVVTHNIGTAPVAVQVYEAGVLIDVDVAITATTATLTASRAATVDVIVIG